MVAGGRCRKLYEKYLEWDTTRCAAWARFAELECSLGEIDRARGIYELAIAQPQLDMPEVRCTIMHYSYLCTCCPHCCAAFVCFVALYRSLCRMLFLLHLKCEYEFDVYLMVQLLWKAYIDMEVGEGQRGATRKLYERLLERTGHVKVSTQCRITISHYSLATIATEDLPQTYTAQRMHAAHVSISDA